MEFSATRVPNQFLSLLSGAVLSVALVFGLQGCSSSGGGTPAPVNADPKGYYTGTAAVKDGSNADLTITDLQGMISGDRFMLMSDAARVLYDGTITNITENDFTATVTIYESDYSANTFDGEVTVTTTTVIGTITEGSQITGTFEGVNAWNGTFSLVYAQSNSEVSSIAKVQTAVGKIWSGDISDLGSNQEFTVDALGNIIHSNAAGTSVFGGCTIGDSSIAPIPETRLYSVIIKFLPTCPTGTFTGFATTKGTDNVLVLAYSDGILAAATDYDLVDL